MPEKIIHLDSKNSNYLLNPSNTTLNTRNSFHTNYKLSQEFSKIKKISLLSLEMPIAFNNIRYGSTNVFSFFPQWNTTRSVHERNESFFYRYINY